MTSSLCLTVGSAPLLGQGHPCKSAHIDVWYVPGVTVNMVAASHFHGEELQFSFGGGGCSVERPDGTVLGKGRLKDNLHEPD